MSFDLSPPSFSSSSRDLEKAHADFDKKFDQEFTKTSNRFDFVFWIFTLLAAVAVVAAILHPPTHVYAGYTVLKLKAIPTNLFLVLAPK